MRVKELQGNAWLAHSSDCHGCLGALAIAADTMILWATRGHKQNSSSLIERVGEARCEQTDMSPLRDTLSPSCLLAGAAVALWS